MPAAMWCLCDVAALNCFFFLLSWSTSGGILILAVHTRQPIQQCSRIAALSQWCIRRCVRQTPKSSEFDIGYRDTITVYPVSRESRPNSEADRISAAVTLSVPQ